MAASPKDYFKNNPNVRIVGYIYETEDESIFKKLEGNRDVEKVSSLKRSMKKNGFINCPILINEKGEVSDGQHRLTAASDIGLPIKFCVQEGMGIEETIDLNTGQRNWSTMNYLHSKALSSKDYARFEQLATIFPFAQPGVIYAAMGGNLTGGAVDKVIKNNTLVCTEPQYEEAAKMLNWLSSFNDLIKANKMKGSKGNFYIALLFAKRCGLVNGQVLTKRVRDNFHIYGTYFSTVEDNVRKTEDAYNFKVPTSNRVYLVDAYRKIADESLNRYRKKE